MIHFNFPDNLTADERKEFTAVNLIAHNILRDSSEARQPCWLCMSKEAKQEARQMAADWFNKAGRPLVPVRVSDECSLRQFENQITDAAAPLMQQWIDAEARYKELRAENNPQAFFTPGRNG